MPSKTTSCKRLVFLDVETNGLDKRKSDIVQFGAVVTCQDDLLDFTTVCEYFETTSPVQVQALLVHQIDNLRAKQLTKYQFFEAFVAESKFFDTSTPTIYVAHNAKFDLGVIGSVLENNGERKVHFGKQVGTLAEAERVRGNCWLDSLPYFRDVLQASTRGSSSLESLAGNSLRIFLR